MTHHKNIHIEFRGHGENVVFSHGTPTHSGEYHQVTKELQTNFRCVLIDHLGFGKSPKPNDGDYSLASHQARFRSSLIQNDIKSFHLIVHDFGGVIALPLTYDPHFKVLSLTILNSWYWPLIETEPQIKTQKFLFHTGLFHFLYRYYNFSPRVLLKMAWGQASPLTKEKHQHYISQFPSRKHRSGTLGFLNSLFQFDLIEWQQSNALQKLNIPVQILWGESDKLISARSLNRWKSIFPDAKIKTQKDVGHFVADEAPEWVAQEIKLFLKSIAQGTTHKSDIQD